MKSTPAKLYSSVALRLEPEHLAVLQAESVRRGDRSINPAIKAVLSAAIAEDKATVPLGGAFRRQRLDGERIVLSVGHDLMDALAKIAVREGARRPDVVYTFLVEACRRGFQSGPG